MSGSFWRSKSYLDTFEWLVLNLNPLQARGKAKAQGMITNMEYRTLAGMDSGFSPRHNEMLLGFLERRDDAFTCLIAIVSEQGCDKEATRLRQALPPAPFPSIPGPAAPLTLVASTHPPAQSRGLAPRDLCGPSRLQPGEILAAAMPVQSTSQAQAGNPWKTEVYRTNRIKLIRGMHPTQMKRACRSLSLMLEYDEEDVDEETKRTDKNEEILKVMERSARKFGKFREILHSIEDVREIAEDLDAVGPDRHTDADCLRAKFVLEKTMQLGSSS